MTLRGNFAKPKTLIDRIQEHFDSLLKDGDAQWHLTRETINRELELINRNIQQMEEQKNTIDQILNPHQKPEILTSNVSPIPKILPSNTVYQMSLQQAKFEPGDLLTENELFVGIAKSEGEHENYEEGRIVVLDMNGQVKCTFGKEISSGKPFFTSCPTRIAANSDIICAIDTSKRNKDNNMLEDGRIVGLNHKGEQKWSYSDKSGDLSEMFHPQDITFTTAGLVLISDVYIDNAIHAINKDGDVTGWIEVKDIGNRMYPMSMDFDDQGTLWVGCGKN
ncbi:unnamed protein product [Mytilus edulis]|uniref:Uncharacterized protein n=1 Tax=Mytilus edulis TaxID=6550 RepID=A0A8S3SZI5_MYTED|nr:unnamed protein product [Mytilus edulis]